MVTSAGSGTDSPPWRACVVLVIAGLLIYANSFAVPWAFDGAHLIRDHQPIRQWWPPWVSMRGTPRPVAMFCFAVNYALQGPEVWGYHLTNLAIHVLAAMTLYGIVRRTLKRDCIAPRLQRAADRLALAVALVWLVHPLQTESVTYLYQRFESLMGLFLLLTLYSFIRGLDSDRPRAWYAASLGCFLLSLGSKEVAAVAPLLLLWYDRTFAASSWRELLRKRGLVHGIFGSILVAPIVYVWVHQKWYAEGGVLAVQKVAITDYALSQPGVILHYLRLCFLPQGQCLDYAWPVARTASEIVPPLLVVSLLIGATVWAVFRRPAWGFLGGWFFLILAPTSSVLPIVDLAFEHRMYLPLAAVVAVAVVGTYELSHRFPVLGGRRWLGGVLAASVVLGTVTVARNEVYRDELSLWSDVVEKASHNARAHVYLGNALRKGHPDQAARHYEIAVRLQPSLGEAHNNLANLLQKTRPDQAMQHYMAALQVNPQHVEAHNNLANLLARQGRFDEAIEHYREATRLRPDYQPAQGNLRVVLKMRQKQTPSVVRSTAEQAASVQKDDTHRGGL